jgi:hypothetical protein
VLNAHQSAVKWSGHHNKDHPVICRQAILFTVPEDARWSDRDPVTWFLADKDTAVGKKTPRASVGLRVMKSLYQIWHHHCNGHWDSRSYGIWRRVVWQTFPMTLLPPAPVRKTSRTLRNTTYILRPGRKNKIK